MIINTETLAITFGLGSAIAWGAGDFSGGIATRRTHVFQVILYSHIIGGAGILALAIGFNEPVPSLSAFFIGAVAGIAGLLGVIALYLGLSRGRMGIVAPVSAVVTAIVPMIYAFLNEGLPSGIQLFGIGVALVSVWFLTCSKETRVGSFDEFILPILAGLGFGLFFIFIDYAVTQSVFWPLVGARTATIALMGVTVLLCGKVRLPNKVQILHIVLAGIFDTAGNAFFALATQLGRLDIAAVLGALYPAATVLLAWLILKERLRRLQWCGVGIALFALVLIAY